MATLANRIKEAGRLKVFWSLWFKALNAVNPNRPQIFRRIKLINGKIGIIMDSEGPKGSFIVLTTGGAIGAMKLSLLPSSNANKLLPDDTNSYTARLKELSNMIKVLLKADWARIAGQDDAWQSRDPLLWIHAYSYIEEIDALTKLTKPLNDLYSQANNAYHNGTSQSPLTDDQFDDLRSFMLKNNISINATQIGAKTDLKVAEKLVHVMPSLEYERTVNGIKEWAKKKNITSFLLSPKYDGVSLQLIYKAGLLNKAFVRGDGYEAKSVLRHIKLIPAIPNKLKHTVDLDVRGEAYIPTKIFKERYWNKAEKKTKNNIFVTARNAVAGWFNRNDPMQEFLNDVRFAVFEVMKGGSALYKQQSLDIAKSEGLPIAILQKIELVNISKLDKILKDYRTTHDFAMDGLVVEEDSIKRRAQIGTETNSINPAFARAFKPQSENNVLAEVVEVTWSLSPTGFLKPTLKLKNPG